jgi:lysophospholipase L1-like esterase
MASTVVTLVWSEALCRVFYAPPSFNSSPSFFNRLKGQRPKWHTEGDYRVGTADKPRLMNVRTNDYGFRGENFSVDKTPGVTRILCMGDSVTFGWGVNNEDTFPARLQQILRAQGASVEVLNAGIGDIGTKEKLTELPLFLRQLDPDIVVWGYYMNDSRPAHGFDDEFMFEGAMNRFFRISLIVRNSNFLRFVYEQLLRIQLRWRLDPGIQQRFTWGELYRSRAWENDPHQAAILLGQARYDWGAAWLPEVWPAVRKDMKVLASLSRQHGFRTVLLALPVSVQAYGALDDRPQRSLAAIARDQKWGFLDPLPAFRQHDPRTLFFDQCHLTPKGNALVADLLGEALKPAQK